MLLGITGVQHAGKDTLYKIIREIVPETKRIALADEMKRAAAIFLGIDFEQIDYLKNNPDFKIVIEHSALPSKHHSELTMREFLRNLGNEGRKLFYEDVWVDILFKGKPVGFDDNKIVCVTDVRYNNEAHIIRSRYGGKVVEINRAGVEREDHESEFGVSRFLIDYTICNDQGFDELRLATHAMLNDLLKSSLVG